MRGSACGCKPGEKPLAARLNKRVIILRPTNERDSYGEREDEMIPVATVWAAVEPLRGREYFAAQSEYVDVTTRIRIRYRADVDRTMIVRCDGVDFEIGHIIDPEFRHRELHLMCKERQ